MYTAVLQSHSLELAIKTKLIESLSDSAELLAQILSHFWLEAANAQYVCCHAVRASAIASYPAHYRGESVPGYEASAAINHL